MAPQHGLPSYSFRASSPLLFYEFQFLFATPSKSLSRKYEQLNVNKRREAVDKAKKMGFFESETRRCKRVRGSMGEGERIALERD
jgi:hypothetical protein